MLMPPFNLKREVPNHRGNLGNSQWVSHLEGGLWLLEIGRVIYLGDATRSSKISSRTYRPTCSRTFTAASVTCTQRKKATPRNKQPTTFSTLTPDSHCKLKCTISSHIIGVKAGQANTKPNLFPSSSSKKQTPKITMLTPMGTVRAWTTYINTLTRRAPTTKKVREPKRGWGSSMWISRLKYHWSCKTKGKTKTISTGSFCNKTASL